MREKEKIKVYFTDFWPDFDIENNFFIDILKKSYVPVLEPKNPDFLFHSCFGYKHLYFDAVKIFYTGENLSPDFNLHDYAIGFDFLSFEDRYFRLPYFRLRMGEEAYEQYSPDFFVKELENKKYFCNFIYSNSALASIAREEFFNKLSKYKRVDSGGKFLNNIGRAVPDKRLWQREYKFSIAFENSYKNGYTTEKIYDALAAHTIPIYWGNPLISRDFNEKRFINAHDFKDFDELIEYIKYIDNSPSEYLKIISEPWFNTLPSPVTEDKELQLFLESIVSKGRKKAIRTTKDGYTKVYLNSFKTIDEFSYFIRVVFKVKKIFNKLKRIFK